MELTGAPGRSASAAVGLRSDLWGLNLGSLGLNESDVSHIATPLGVAPHFLRSDHRCRKEGKSRLTAWPGYSTRQRAG